MVASELHPVLRGTPYQGYVYAYPHKTAYRAFAPRPLTEVWAHEPRAGLFLYVHVPFCTMRCGFCNLFTTARPKGELVAFYLDALARQARAVRDAVPDARFARFAIGGGTPTYLNELELIELFDVVERVTGADARAIPTAVEASPDTLTPAKVEVLKARGVERVSLGIQSFIESETAGSGRPQTRAQLDRALALVSGAGFAALNLDLIYGLPGQTIETWLYSLHEVLRYAPQELYLYPLYVRPLTGLGGAQKEWDDVRLGCYRAAREVLLGEGYEQVSMRMFRRRAPQPAPEHTARPYYCCQQDGMIGLGCGARSYTRGLHYSLDYAVRPKSIKEIIADYVARTRDEFTSAVHGFALDADEQKRRYLLQSILNTEGLDTRSYATRFGTDPGDDFPELRTLVEAALLTFDRGTWRPTPLGLERSDALGPWFFSQQVQRLMAGYEQK